MHGAIFASDTAKDLFKSAVDSVQPPHYTTALREIIQNTKNEQQESDYRMFNKICAETAAKAGEVMRERCIGVATVAGSNFDGRIEKRIGALPGVTLEDLK